MPLGIGRLVYETVGSNLQKSIKDFFKDGSMQKRMRLRGNLECKNKIFGAIQRTKTVRLRE